jgi:hypothetical protein
LAPGGAARRRVDDLRQPLHRRTRLPSVSARALCCCKTAFTCRGTLGGPTNSRRSRLRRSTVETSGSPTPFIHPGDGDPRHGSDNGYSNLRCRCQQCRQAWARTYQKRRQRKRSEPTPVDAHGTVSGYSYWGCRCAKCTEIHTEHHRRLRYRRRSEQSLIQRDGRVSVTVSVNMAADAKDADPE